MKTLVFALLAAGALHSYHIRFAAVVGSEKFACEVTYKGLGTTHTAVTPEFLRLYVSRVTLIDQSGKAVPLALDQDGVWQQHDVAFLSFEGSNASCASGSPQEHDVVSGSAPEGRYVAVQFVVGVPQSLDHADATIAASPLNLSDMFWSWQDGYKFFRLDARIRGGDGRTSGFVFHLGSTGCRGSGSAAHCAHVNEAVVRVAHYDASRTIVLDVAKLLERVDLQRGGGCMMLAGEVCTPELRALGLLGAEQTVFSAR